MACFRYCARVYHFVFLALLGIMLSCSPDQAEKVRVLQPPYDLARGASFPDRIELSWKNHPEQSPLFDVFYIYCSTNTNVGYAVAGTTSATNFSITNLQGNTRYYLMVRAHSVEDRFSYDSEVLAVVTGNTAPEVPQNVRFGDISTNSITLLWDPAIDEDGAVTNYYVYFNTAQFGIYSLAGTSTSTSLTIEGLQSGCVYYFKVRAVDDQGDLSNPGDAVVTNTINRVPEAPAAPMASGATVNSVQLCWSAAVDPDGTIINYTVYGSVTSGSGHVAVGSTQGTNITVTGLEPRTRYYFVLVATDNWGQPSPFSEECSVSTRSLAPSPPANVVTNSMSAGSISIAWDPATDPDGTITNYSIYTSGTSGGPYAKAGDSATTSFVINGLASGVRVYIVVRAMDNNGDVSAYSSEISGITIPAPPAGVSASDNRGVVTISWNAATGATGYTVLRAADSAGPYAEIGTTTGMSLVDAAVVKYTTNYYAVCAYNASGVSERSTCDPGYRLQNYTDAGTFGSGLGTTKAVAMDREETCVYVTEPFNHTLKKFDMSGNLIYSKTLTHAAGLAVDSAGIVYAGGGYSTLNIGIHRFMPDGTELSTWLCPTYRRPDSIFVDETDTIYSIGDGYPYLYKYNTSGTILTNWWKLVLPYSVAVYSNTIYVSDSNWPNRISKRDGNYTEIGTWNVATVGDYPGMTVDSSGNIFIATGNYIQKYSPDGKLLAYFYSGFSTATDIHVTSTGRLYVSGSGRTYLNMFDPEL